jgi:hypothetical protein
MKFAQTQFAQSCARERWIRRSLNRVDATATDTSDNAAQKGNPTMMLLTFVDV